MHTNRKRRSSGIKWLLLASLLIVFLILMTSYHGMEWLLAKVVFPIRDRTTERAQLGREKSEMAFELNFLKNKNAELEIENGVLKEELKTISRGAEFSRKWVDYPNVKSTVSRIIFKDPSGLSTTFIIDAGSSKGVKKGMPVMGRETLIGRVVEVHPSFSRIRTIQSTKIAFGAVVQRTKELGVVIGSSDGLILKYLSINADVKVGDAVITSGTTDITPQGLYIGKVNEVILREKDEELEAKISSPENIESLEFVRVVMATMPVPEGSSIKD